MVHLTILVADLPTTCVPYGAIRLKLQKKKGLADPVNGVFVVTLERKLNRKGEEHWAGDDVHFHGDGRRFIYLQWIGQSGQMFRRIKLYLDHIMELDPTKPDQEITVKIHGRGKDGSPACSTAKLV